MTSLFSPASPIEAEEPPLEISPNTTALADGAERIEVSDESDAAHITDEQREFLIRRAGRMMRLEMARWERTGCFGYRGAADYWRMTMQADIARRSPAQVARLEKERGLA